MRSIHKNAQRNAEGRDAKPRHRCGKISEKRKKSCQMCRKLLTNPQKPVILSGWERGKKDLHRLAKLAIVTVLHLVFTLSRKLARSPLHLELRLSTPVLHLHSRQRNFITSVLHLFGRRRHCALLYFHLLFGNFGMNI